MTLTDCLRKRFGECEGRVVLEYKSVSLGSRRKLRKSAVVEGFGVIL